MNIDWSRQHCGVHQATSYQLLCLMPDLSDLLLTFPENAGDFIWDVKVHMLMPGQFPCIPNWHFDNVPRVNNKQDFSQVNASLPMYLWISGEPLTEFRKNGETTKITPQTWHRFTQDDEHRGTKSEDFCWRGFIRATHKDLLKDWEKKPTAHRRHSQVYLDANNFYW